MTTKPVCFTHNFNGIELSCHATVYYQPATRDFPSESNIDNLYVEAPNGEAVDVEGIYLKNNVGKFISLYDELSERAYDEYYND